MSRYSNPEWLASLKPGDRVCIMRSCYGEITASLDTVDRLTKTLVCVGKGRFRRSNGCSLGDYGFRTSRIVSPDDKAAQAALQDAAVQRLRYEVQGAADKCGDIDALRLALGVLGGLDSGEAEEGGAE